MKYRGFEIDVCDEQMIRWAIVDFIKRNVLPLDAEAIFIELKARCWRTHEGLPIKNIEAVLTGMNGVKKYKVGSTKISKTKKKMRKAVKENAKLVDAVEKRIKNQKRKSYNELLQDPRWQKRRLEIMQRDNWTCQMCGNGLNDGIPMNVHHKVYHRGRKPWEYNDDELLTICEKCHSKLHNK